MANSKVLVVGKGFIGTQLSNFLASDEKIEVHAIDSSQVNYRDYNTFLDSAKYHGYNDIIKYFTVPFTD